MHTKIFKFILAIGIINTVLSSLLTTEQGQLVLCGLNVLDRHFKTGRNLLVSFSHTTYNTPQQHTLTQTSNSKNYIHVVNSLLQKTHDAARWLIQVSTPDEPSIETKYEGQGKIDYYLVIVRPKGTEEQTFDDVLNQFGSFPQMKSWNQRALFLVMLTGTAKEPKVLALRIFEELWKSENILNIVLLVRIDEEILLHDKARDTENSAVFYMYTWFPYRSGHCASVEEVALLDQWIATDSGGFLKQVPLFPNKIPTDLQACPIRVSTAEDQPYVFLNNVQHNNISKYSGLEIQFLLITSQVMNATLVYLPPPTGTAVLKRISSLASLSFGLCDLVVGLLPIDLHIMEYAEPTTPHLQTALRWLIPCPTPVPRVESLLGIFKLPVWFSLILVLILMTAVLWCSSNCHFSFLEQDSPIYKTLSGSLCNVWAVFLSVPLARLPSTTRLRIWFLLFIWYCFAINIVFQAFFITFLVEPSYRKRIESFDDLVHSELMYGYYEDTEIALNISRYYERTRIKSPRFYCSDHDKCLERLVRHGDITMVSIALAAEYNAFKFIPSYKKRKHVCFINEDIHKTFLVMYMQRGHPLLHRVNTVIRRVVEAGLVDNYWSMMKWGVRLNNVANSTHDGRLTDGNQFFALSLSHLKVVFIVLLAGYTLSSIIFAAELLHALISTRGK